MDFKTFMCALILYNHNFNMIKWNAYGTDFERIRGTADRCSGVIDSIFRWRYTEAISIDFDFPSYEEVLSVLSDCEMNFLHFEESKRFSDLEEVLSLCYTMTRDLVECMDAFTEDSDAYKFVNCQGKEIRDLYAEYKRMNIKAEEPDEDRDDDDHEPGYVDFDSDEEDDLPDIDLDNHDDDHEDSPEGDDNDLSNFGFPIAED